MTVSPLDVTDDRRMLDQIAAHVNVDGREYHVLFHPSASGEYTPTRILPETFDYVDISDIRDDDIVATAIEMVEDETNADLVYR